MQIAAMSLCLPVNFGNYKHGRTVAFVVPTINTNIMRVTARHRYELLQLISSLTAEIFQSTLVRSVVFVVPTINTKSGVLLSLYI